jgi:hypothetical protein
VSSDDFKTKPANLKVSFQDWKDVRRLKVMPYLDWTQKSVRLIATPLTGGKLQLTLGLKREELQRLESDLTEVYLQGGRELRMGLPQEWVLFWKKREEGSRLLVAHPQPNEWVGTVALDEAFGQQLLSGLKKLEEGASFTVNRLSPVASVSNLELIMICES